LFRGAEIVPLFCNYFPKIPSKNHIDAIHSVEAMMEKTQYPCYTENGGDNGMSALRYTFMNDTLFKMLFTKHPVLLKRLTSELLGISYDSIEKFAITNPDIPPDVRDEKFCRLDINMTVDGQFVDLEIQVANEGNYPERSLYYWARDYSSGLKAGQDYIDLPRTVHISIVAFKMFDCEDFHSEFQLLEVQRHVQLTDKQVLHYFELPKLPKEINREDELKLWLHLFHAETEEDIVKIAAMEVPIMEEAIGAYKQLTATDEFKELERLREKARHDEASALRHARQEGEKQECEKWQNVVAEKDMLIAKLQAQLNGSI
jgi:predicted transposase/invertase (TIGR01784 family)